MKFLRDKIDQIKKPFEKGQKFEKFAPAINALDTFLYVPNHTTKHGAHIRDAVDLKRTMITVVLALVPALLFGIYNAGYQHFIQLNDGVLPSFMDIFLHGLWKVLPMIIVSYAVGLGIEFAFAIFRGHEVNEGYLVSGLLIPMVMPVDLPLWMLAISVAFAVIIGKEAFGGTGMNIFNPALLARAFAFFAYPTFMSGDKIWVSEASTTDAISGETILGSLAQGKEVAYSTMDMFLGFIPGSIGETSVLAILIGAFILIATGVGSWKIMVSGVVGAALTAMMFNAVGLTALMNFDWTNHLVVGGFAFGIVFMATDPVSAAQTDKGKIIYGLLIGFFSIMIRVFNPAYPEGVMLAILLMNTLAPTIDYFVVNGNISKRKKRLAKSKQLKSA
ncbi:NADH:ubiquinone reductase (Na(+)-transporting) subunit B [Flavobacterium cheniae]|uniref:Na(+)-translocating NADH-quinone reductase subunit B n=1 Tax=Flavobacterium cheniae TaxID=295428 RepID=A0A562KLX7_9FLAO|nr:NADH:ubiquinone reductase (Na(+)-transporting) subunit B [Flavobacterium cheniae]TDR24113.1 Na(+)-translocating NADH:ubiquinone oxidoreductase B subunit [Flavobacterium cheniae]TWH96233.1 Na+-transporting NADH:ubiquinone oxidoreductase subunit B [Flavobacterium cheniae]